MIPGYDHPRSPQEMDASAENARITEAYMEGGRAVDFPG